MSYWEWLGQFNLGEAWVPISGILAGAVIVGGLFGVVVAALGLADRGHGGWNWLVIPAGLAAIFFVVTLLAFSAGVGVPA